MSTLKMIVGLGNPGPEYTKNRHNIGFQCVELLARRHSLDAGKMQNRAMITQGFIRKNSKTSLPGSGDAIQTLQQQKVLLVKPLTFMNLSGEAVGQLARFYQLEPSDVIVIHDDLDLASGKLRLRMGGSSGGQNGIKSIIQHLGTPDFARVKVGIGRPPGRMDAAAYVLQNFSSEEEENFAILRQTVCDAVECWLFDGIEVAMNRFNGEKVDKVAKLQSGKVAK